MIKEWTRLKGLDAEVRTVEKPDKKKGERMYHVDVGLFESLGERGGDILTLAYLKSPTVKEIRKDVKERYKETKKEILGAYLGATSGRQDMQLKALRKVI